MIHVEDQLGDLGLLVMGLQLVEIGIVNQGRIDRQFPREGERRAIGGRELRLVRLVDGEDGVVVKPQGAKTVARIGHRVPGVSARADTQASCALSRGDRSPLASEASRSATFAGPALGKLSRRQAQFGIGSCVGNESAGIIVRAVDSSTSANRGFRCLISFHLASTADRDSNGGRGLAAAMHRARGFRRHRADLGHDRCVLRRGWRQVESEVLLSQSQRAGPSVHRVEPRHDPDDLLHLDVLEVPAQRVDVGLGDGLWRRSSASAPRRTRRARNG